jgi:hypothetical protein
VVKCGPQVGKKEEKKCHQVVGSRKEEQVSRWVKYIVFQAMQRFRGEEEF